MKKSTVIAIVLFTIVALGIVAFLITVFLNDDMAPPKLPTTSVQNKLILTSNGCCFWVENVRVSLQDNNGNKIEISENEAIYKHDIFKYDIPDFPSGPVKMIVEFRSFYSDECDFAFSVLELENISKLKETGVLLYFQEHDDMYLNVIAGDYHASYKMGSSENRWLIMDTPNKVYP